MSENVISELVIYPVKSLQGISVAEAELTEQGLKWDRYWMVVNEEGQFATQRHFAQMATVKTEITDSHLVLSHPEHSDFKVELSVSTELSERVRQVKVWKSECTALDEGKEVSDWLTKVLGQWRGQNLSLVRMSPEFERQVSSSHTNGTSNTTLFSDGYPYLITTTASLSALNARLKQVSEQAIPMSRFRANVVIDNSDEVNSAFIENRSSTLSVQRANIQFDLCKPCERCKVPSINQTSGFAQSPQQPLKTLFSMDHVAEKGAYFGQNAVIDADSKTDLTNKEVVLKVGDRVEFSS